MWTNAKQVWWNSGLFVVERVSRVDAGKSEQPWEEEANVQASRRSSIEAISPQYIQQMREFADKPMLPLPKDFLKPVK